jgi:hypothetical protein
VKKLKVLSYATLALAAVWLAAAAAPLVAPWYASECTSDVVRVQATVSERKRAFENSAGGDRQVECAARREYVATLKEATPILARCGPAQMTRVGAWPVPDAELTFNERLCGNVAREAESELTCKRTSPPSS